MNKLAIVTAIAALALVACDKSDTAKQAKQQSNAQSLATAASTPANSPLMSMPPANADTTHTLAQKPSLSPQVILQNDYSQIKQLAQSKQAEILSINREIISASQEQDISKLKTLYPKLSGLLSEFNQQLNAIHLNNSEVIALREKMIEGNNISIDMMQLSLSGKGDQNQLRAIFEKAAIIQQDLLSMDLKIQNQFPAVNNTSSATLSNSNN